MVKKSGFEAEKNTGIKLMRNIHSMFRIMAFADEQKDTGNTDGGSNDTGDNKSNLNFEDLITAARKEEKDKQYKKIEKIKEQNNTLVEQHNNDLLKIASLEKEVKEAKEKLISSGKGDSDEVKNLKSTVADLEKTKADLEKRLKEFEDNKPQSREEIEKEVREELEKEYEVRAYRAEKLAELKDDILVPEYVMGDTKEAIDASIEKALERSKEIKEKLGISNDDAGSPKKETKPQKRTPKTPNSPSISGGNGKEVSLEYLASLDVRSKEYAEIRKQLGLK